ncbi:hypothetical protein R5H30_01185 [Sulfitobacter sp. D35]|uniref:hypothetical protein n=1 Tax=Sulfitobacter sp. D35 TaxID=3083252 RepID=UPI00296F67BA|nr:hypothetical protein [Sulfitobacter sp. D35]MDW4496578.1 hypothetical protein [Sulfitobacter sp. D35]
MAEYIKLAKMPKKAEKLLLALISIQDTLPYGWSTVFDPYREPGVYFAYTNELRALGIAQNERSARSIRASAACLYANTELFRFVNVPPGKDYIQWQFSQSADVFMTDMERYALVSAADICHCSREFDGRLLTQIMLHHKMDRPQFCLFEQDTRIRVLKQMPETPTFRAAELTPRLKPCLQKWSNLKGYTFAVAYLQSGSQPGYTDVRIRIRHGKTVWPDGSFMKFDPRAHVYRVNPAKRQQQRPAAPSTRPGFGHGTELWDDPL